jgi:Ca2+:H+ antiporter
MGSGVAIHVRKEWFLLVSAITCLIFYLHGDSLFAKLEDPLWLSGIFAWLFTVVLSSAFSVVRHADHLAIRLGEPYGTLILTLSVTSIEVMSISTVMMHGENDPVLVRDTLFSVVMIILNGMVGLSLLIGALKHREQHYNLQGANTYLGVIIPLAVLSLILPSYTQTTPGPTLSTAQGVFLILMSVSLYGTFLVMQTSRHQSYFIASEEHLDAHDHASKNVSHSLVYHAVLLLAYMLPVVFLAEQLAHPIDYLIETLHIPGGVDGMIIAVLVATPEGISAVRAAKANQLQRSMNIFLGSVLSTIGLTVPAMLIISYLTGETLILGLQNTDVVMLLLTLGVSVVTFASGRTNVLQGAVHLILFAAYLLLIFQN